MRISARNRSARERPGSRRWDRRDRVREQTFGSLSLRGQPTFGGVGASDCLGLGSWSSTGSACFRSVGRQGESKIDCHRDSKVMYMGATWRSPETYLEEFVLCGGRANGSRTRISLLS
jgi:hypothetical protein